MAYWQEAGPVVCFTYKPCTDCTFVIFYQVCWHSLCGGYTVYSIYFTRSTLNFKSWGELKIKTSIFDYVSHLFIESWNNKIKRQLKQRVEVKLHKKRWMDGWTDYSSTIIPWVFPGLISAMILIYIYEAPFFTPTSLLQQQQVFSWCSIQPQFQKNTQCYTGMKYSILFQNKCPSTAHPAHSQTQSQTHTEVHISWRLKSFTLGASKVKKNSLQSTGACKIPKSSRCVCCYMQH